MHVSQVSTCTESQAHKWEKTMKVPNCTHILIQCNVRCNYFVIVKEKKCMYLQEKRNQRIFLVIYFPLQKSNNHTGTSCRDTRPIMYVPQKNSKLEL